MLVYLLFNWLVMFHIHNFTNKRKSTGRRCSSNYTVVRKMWCSRQECAAVQMQSERTDRWGAINMWQMKSAQCIVVPSHLLTTDQHDFYEQETNMKRLRSKVRMRQKSRKSLERDLIMAIIVMATCASGWYFNIPWKQIAHGDIMHVFMRFKKTNGGEA